MLKLNKSTRYALYAAMEMAQAEGGSPVTAAQVAERFDVPATVLAKVFQQLVRAEIAVGSRGSGGGYRLTGNPSTVTLLNVVEALEPARQPGQCLLHDGPRGDCRKHAECRLRRLFDEIDEISRSTLASITLETLVGKPQPGMGVPVTPLTLE